MARLIAILLSISLLTAPAYAKEIPSANQVSQEFSQVAEKSIPGVVSIHVTMRKQPDSYRMQIQDPSQRFQDDFWNRFFRGPQGQQRPQPQQQPPKPEGRGSGFLVTEDGFILTNNHIVGNAEEIRVILENGREYSAKLIGQDPNSDIAVIKIEGQNLPYLTLGSSEDLHVGQWVMAIGNMLGFRASVTVGVVSAKGRSNLGITEFENYIQTDAAINRGNSGGPLITLDGKVVGMNTAFATNYGGYTGIGFAIPSSMLDLILDQIMADGGVTRSYVGVMLQKIDSDLADAFGLNRVQGALIADIVPDSPADRAGLKQGDVILTLNSKEVKNIGLFRNQVSLFKPGTKIKLGIHRNGQLQEMEVELETHPNMAQGSSAQQTPSLGLHVEIASPDSNESGVKVTKVEPGSLAAFAGIKPGAHILTVNNQKVNTPEEFRKLIEDSPEERPVALLIKQGNTTRFISLQAK